MAYNNLFVDSDIILDMLLQREPFYHFTHLLFTEKEKSGFSLNTSALVIANLNYVLSSNLGRIRAKDIISSLIDDINILPFESEIISLALKSSFTDFEDSLQYFIAQKHHCDLIITRNIKDYKQSAIPVLTAEQFLRTLPL